MKSRILILGLIVAALLLSGHFGKGQESQAELVKQVFGQYTKEEGVHNAFFRIESVNKKLEEDLFYGILSNGHKVTSKTPFYTASIGKTFTAVAIARLVEEKKLSFDDRVIDYLGSLVNGLHVIDGVDYSSALTIHHLLSHTSGLPDYFEDESNSGVNMIQKLFIEPHRMWQPEELLSFTKRNFSAFFKPGESYHYTDTEYVLLGLVVQQITGMKLHEYFEAEIFKPLSLNLTSMNLRSEPVETPDVHMAEIYMETMEISQFKSLSADWAGGAIRSTGKDLNNFLRSLLNGEVISKDILAQMQQWVPEGQGIYYGYGLRKWVLAELSPEFPELTLIGHSGVTGSFMYYCRELRLYLSGTFNQTEFVQKHMVFIADLLTKLEEYSKK